MEFHLKLIGILLILLSLVHLYFPTYFDWKVQLSSLKLINRQMMYIHSYFIAFVVLLIGLLCLTSTSDLLTTALGNRISLGLAVFWFVRLIVQFFGYTPATWKGKTFETGMHILFAFFWAYLSVIFYLVSRL